MKHTKAIVFGFGWFLSTALHSAPQSNLDAFIQQQTPTGWQVYQTAQGDLNRDRLPDVALVIQELDPAKIKAHDGLGADQLNLNPRRLIIGLQTAKGYQLHSAVDGAIPSEHSQETPCLADPFEKETNNLLINKGVLVLQFHYWLSCGSYATSTDTYRFRLDDTKRFRLIGQDALSSHRASGEIHLNSRNLLTGTQIDEYGNISEDKPERVKRTKFKVPPAQYLDHFKLDE